MQVLIPIVPGHGHLLPTLPLARALRDAGHEVRYATSRSFAPTVQEQGFRTVEAGLDYTQAGLRSDDRDQTLARLYSHMLVDGEPAMLADLLDHFASSPPDVILTDPNVLAAAVAAEACGVPWGAIDLHVRAPHLPGLEPLDPGERQAQRDALQPGVHARLREAAGLPPHDLEPHEAPWDRTFSLELAPPSLLGAPLDWWSHTVHPLRYEVPSVDRSDGDDADAWRRELSGRRPVVGVSLGSFWASDDVYREVVAASLSQDVDVVAACPFDLDDHPRLVHRGWIAMDALLDAADVLVHHGGFGTTMAAVATGTASVVRPFMGDQHVHAQQLTATGAGLAVRRTDDTRTAVAGALGRALTDQLFTGNARRLAAEVAAMPEAAQVVPVVEHLAADGPPVVRSAG